MTAWFAENAFFVLVLLVCVGMHLFMHRSMSHGRSGSEGAGSGDHESRPPSGQMEER